MSILNLQRRLAQVGRLRLGEKKVKDQGNGKTTTYPSKLSKWRVTSNDRQRLAAIAQIYGGTVREWDNQFEVYTDTDALDVAVVPGQALTQHYEAWGQEHARGTKNNPVICLRRCDSQTCLVPNAKGKGWTEGPCLCADEEEPTCKPTTRLSVVLTKIPGLGVWRCDSKGWAAAAELSGSVQLLESLIASGRPVRARLSVEIVTETKRAGTFKYPKPRLDIDHTLDEVLAIAHGYAPRVIDASTGQGVATGGNSGQVALPPASAPAPPFDPVPPTPPPDADQSVADQLRAPVVTGARGPHVPIQPTGLDPRRTPDAGASASPVEGEGGEPEPNDGTSLGSPPDQFAAGEADGREASGAAGNGEDEPSPAANEGPGGMPLQQAVAMWCKDAGIETPDDRHAFLLAVSRVVGDGEYSSSKDVPREHVQALRKALDRIKNGELGLDTSGPALVHRESGEIVTTTGMPVTPAGAEDGPWDVARWRDATKNVPGIGISKLLREARKIAPRFDLEPPPDADHITDERLVTALLMWLKEQRG